jgi:DNA-binding PadR family transcriptional regulator
VRLSFETIRVLAELLQDATEPRYGLEIVRRTGMLPGTLYPIVVRLEAARWIVTSWEELDPKKAGRPLRKFIQQTELGRSETLRRLREHNLLVIVQRGNEEPAGVIETHDDKETLVYDTHVD